MNDYIDFHTHQMPLQPTALHTLYNLPHPNSMLPPATSGIYYTAGIHPYRLVAKEIDITNELMALNQLASTQKIVAIGECGIDKRINYPLEKQLEIVEKQLEIAERYQLPVILHIVQGYNEIMALRKTRNYTTPWAIHQFRGKPQLAQQLLKAQIHLSFSTQHNIESITTANPHFFLESDNSARPIAELYAEVAAKLHLEIEDLCKIIHTHWNTFMPAQKKY